jgi:hypothetical protein
MQLVEKIILEHQKEKGLINFVDDYELIYWLEKTDNITSEKEQLLKKAIKREKLNYKEEKAVAKIISTNKENNLTFNELSLKAFNKYNNNEELKHYERKHLERFIEQGELQIIKGKVVPTYSWERRKELLYREKNNKKLIPKEIREVTNQLKDFLYLEEQQIIKHIYHGNKDTYLADKKQLIKNKDIECINVIRGKIKISKKSNNYLDFQKLKNTKIKQNYLTFGYTNKEIESLTEPERKKINNLIKFTQEHGYLENNVVYKKKNESNINVVEFNHDRYIYDAYCHAKKTIEENNGIIQRILNEKQQKQELYTGKTNIQSVKHPDLIIIYEDKNKKIEKLNIEVAISYKPSYIKDKADNFNQLQWYCIDRNQYKVIQENTPSNHQVYLLPRRW